MLELEIRAVCIDVVLLEELEHDFANVPCVGAYVDCFVAVGFVWRGEVERFLSRSVSGCCDAIMFSDTQDLPEERYHVFQ